MSIEEAWKNVKGVEGQLTPGTIHEGCVAEAARAFGLAVHDGACGRRHFAKSQWCGSEWSCPKRLEIEALR